MRLNRKTKKKKTAGNDTRNSTAYPRCFLFILLIATTGVPYYGQLFENQYISGFESVLFLILLLHTGIIFSKKKYLLVYMYAGRFQKVNAQDKQTKIASNPIKQD